MTKALVAVVAASLITFGATTADAKKGHGDGGGGGHHGGGWGGDHHGHHDSHKFNRFNYLWWGYPWYPSCHYEPQKVRIRVWDRWGNPYFKWVWRDVKVCY